MTTKRWATPTEPGFYWAKWKIADESDNKAEYDTYLPDNTWEVMDVFENHLRKNEPDYLRVRIPGIEDSLSLENFFWGPGAVTGAKAMTDERGPNLRMDATEELAELERGRVGGRKCPRCGSPDPKLHPAVQFEGEVQLCHHPYHAGADLTRALAERIQSAAALPPAL